MLIPGIEFRYINYCCYEIVLPNGKEIVIDPCIDFKGESSLKKKILKVLTIFYCLIRIMIIRWIWDI